MRASAGRDETNRAAFGLRVALTSVYHDNVMHGIVALATGAW